MIKVSELLDESSHLELKPLNKDADYSKTISGGVLNRPGLALAGFFEQFAADRVQVFGRGEAAYLEFLESSPPENNILKQCAEKFFSYDVSCLIFSHSKTPPVDFLNAAVQKQIPVFTTPYTTHKLSVILNDILGLMAPKTSYHGVLVDVFGVGVLITGKTGVGKSESALELIERGHRLIADDAVLLYKRGEFSVHGTVADTIAYHMEIRGLGIINIKDLYGAGAIRKDISIDIILHLEDWNETKAYDRTGLVEKTHSLLDVEIPYLLVPVKPGRNIPLLVETAAKNFRLKGMGYHPAREFNEGLIKKMNPKKKSE